MLNIGKWAVLILPLIFVVPAQASLIINEILADPASGLAGDSNGDGVRDASQDEFVELLNISGSVLDISGWTIHDGAALRHTFAAGSLLADQMAVVVFGGGTPAGVYAGSLVTTASSGLLGFNNSGDIIQVFDASANLITSLIYGPEGGDNQSLTRFPDLTGTFVKHTTVSSLNYSPGTQLDGSAFRKTTELPEPVSVALLLLGLFGLCIIHLSRGQDSAVYNGLTGR